MSSRSLRLGFAATASTAFIAILIACSSKDPLPPPYEDPTNQLSDAAPRRDAATDGGKGTDGGDGGIEYPKSCSNTIRDSKETDVDCGGNECPKCIDGKVCVADTDCAGGSCVNKQCVTPACTDGVTNGGESDVDCGGSTCARCTTGKKCGSGADCLSGTCVNQACGCPAGMAIVPKASGGAYCIDSAEVTKGQYNKFLTANQPVDEQLDICRPPTNATFVPRGAWPPATEPPGTNGLEYNLGLPVHYVDWCDAYAYCKWANKQLCGKINGGTNALADANDATKSAWFNACSAQSTRDWPYSTSFDKDKCNGYGGTYDGGVPQPQPPPQDPRWGYGGANQDKGVQVVAQGDVSGNISAYLGKSCQGGVVGVYQMSGNVAEWEDSCDGTAASASCKLRGGSFQAADDPDTLKCNADRMLARAPAAAGNPDTDPLRDVGFRCCLY